jgi:Bacterial DNA-binding protein
VKIAEKCESQAVSMTKADLIAVIADRLKFPWARAELLVDVVFDCLEQSMSRGEKIEIRATRPNYPYTRLFFALEVGEWPARTQRFSCIT